MKKGRRRNWIKKSKLTFPVICYLVIFSSSYGLSSSPRNGKSLWKILWKDSNVFFNLLCADHHVCLAYDRLTSWNLGWERRKVMILNDFQLFRMILNYFEWFWLRLICVLSSSSNQWRPHPPPPRPHHRSSSSSSCARPPPPARTPSPPAQSRPAKVLSVELKFAKKITN